MAVNVFRRFPLQAHPYVRLCVCDQKTMTCVRMGGRVNLTTERSVLGRCFEAGPVLTGQFGNRQDEVIGYYLTEGRAEFASFPAELSGYRFPNRSDAAE